MIRRVHWSRGALSEGKFQENKDWNSTNAKMDANVLEVRGQVPRKQGLKPQPMMLDVAAAEREVRGQVPRKQGLKHGKRPWFAGEISESEGKFQENKDWNPAAISCFHLAGRSEGKFQENKDWNSVSVASDDVTVILSEGKFQENKDWNSVA